MYYIYTLNRSDNKMPFYVGMTNDPDRRLKEHSHSGVAQDMLVSRYIEGLLVHDIEPIMEIIKSVDTKEDALSEEADLIDELYKDFVLMNERFPSIEIQRRDKFDWFALVTKEEKIEHCGIGGYFCNYYHDCEICNKLEKKRRIEAIRDILSGEQNIYYTVVSKERRLAADKYMNRYNIDSIRIPNDNTTLVITNSALHSRYGKSIEVCYDDAMEILSSNENIFPSGRRASSGRWRLH